MIANDTTEADQEDRKWWDTSKNISETTPMSKDYTTRTLMNKEQEIEQREDKAPTDMSVASRP